MGQQKPRATRDMNELPRRPAKTLPGREVVAEGGVEVTFRARFRTQRAALAAVRAAKSGSIFAPTLQDTVVGVEAALEEQLSRPLPVDPKAVGERNRTWLHEAAAQGEAQLVAWIDDGTLLPVSVLEDRWKVSRQAIDVARKDRNELFSLFIKGQHWYPAEFLKLSRQDLARINQELADLDPTSKLLFFLKRHGALADRTVADAVNAGQRDAVLRLAQLRVHG